MDMTNTFTGTQDENNMNVTFLRLTEPILIKESASRQLKAARSQQRKARRNHCFASDLFSK